jgi:hypothetical protein
MGAVNTLPGGTGMQGCGVIGFIRNVIVIALNESTFYFARKTGSLAIPGTGGWDGYLKVPCDVPLCRLNNPTVLNIIQF